MAKAQVRVLPSARNTVMVVDDQSTGRASREQVVRSRDARGRRGTSPTWCSSIT